jgi:hypothetical protein
MFSKNFALKWIPLLLLHTGFASAATVTVVSQDTVKIEGNIVSGDFAKLKLVLLPAVQRIVVNSFGGNAEEGLNMGELLRSHGVDVEVNDVCVSSCANYIFTSGRRKILNQGVVGFHGNISATITIAKSETVEDLKKSGLSDAQINDVLAHYGEIAKKEAAFFSSLGISQALFDRTQLRDKGMGDGKTYVMLAPSPATFLKYGVTGVEGDESMEVIKTNPSLKRAAELGEPVLVD